MSQDHWENAKARAARGEKHPQAHDWHEHDTGIMRGDLPPDCPLIVWKCRRCGIEGDFSPGTCIYLDETNPCPHAP